MIPQFDYYLAHNYSIYLMLFWFFLGYIGEFEYVDDHRAGKIVVELNGRLNKCGVISPRFDVGVKEIEGWNARLLPSRQVSSKASFFFEHQKSVFAKKKNLIRVISCLQCGHNTIVWSLRI